ncbi:MAG TPA: hypothetical protein VFG04_17400 [Planctomycetaceae bacterium]|jgi:hypothetical protein|nr:hypothetical protein [Planctomycetaceae bacterium]
MIIWRILAEFQDLLSEATYAGYGIRMTRAFFSRAGVIGASSFSSHATSFESTIETVTTFVWPFMSVKLLVAVHGRFHQDVWQSGAQNSVPKTVFTPRIYRSILADRRKRLRLTN